jgi:hypothetical protein
MRYSIVNQGLISVAHYGDFDPKGTQTGGNTRYSDEQLYALALYLQSLKPPPNLNRFDDDAKRGQAIFNRQGCAGCHPAPLYTNNKLTPAKGFTVPDALRKSEAILDLCVGTDPGLALETRRGTVSTRSLRFGVCGCAASSGTKAKPHPSKSGSTPPASTLTTYPRVSTSLPVRFKVTNLVSSYQPPIGRH